jgi:hypothetical protein
VWIKLYTRLENDPEWDALSLSERGLLVSLWMLHARSNAGARQSQVRRKFGSRHLEGQLKRLSDAGFIQFVASKPLALRYQGASPEGEGEKEREKDSPLPPHRDEGASPVERSKARDNGRRPSPLHRQAIAWLENVGAQEVPPDSLRRVLREEFPGLSAEELHELEGLAEVLRA